jgi:hypothetical protein
MAHFHLRAPLSRRTFLRGSGVALALPWLEAMVPSVAFARGRLSPPRSSAPLRFAFLFVPNGKWMKAWTPATPAGATTSELAELPPSLSPLAAVRPKLVVLSGLTQANAFAKGDGPGDHARSAAAFLTGAHPKKTEGADLRNGVSIDQLLAQRLGDATRLPSLEVGCEPPLTSGNCDSGYSCAYSCNVSWRSATTPQLKEVDPRLVFERLFADGEDATPEQRAQRLARRRSLLDYANDEAARLKAQLGATDRRKLDEYTTAVREVERRIEKAETDARRAAVENAPSQSGALAAATQKPAGVPATFAEHVNLLSDLLALAFQSDLTRVATHMFANDGNNKSFPWLDVPDGHHEVSHHGGEAGKIAKLHVIDRFHVELLGHFLARLAATSEGDGTLLDHTLVLYGAGISDGNAHNHDDLPIVLAGGGNGTVQPSATGRHLRLKNGTPLCNLFVSLLDRADVRVQSFGDSDGRIDAL